MYIRKRGNAFYIVRSEWIAERGTSKAVTTYLGSDFWIAAEKLKEVAPEYEYKELEVKLFEFAPDTTETAEKVAKIRKLLTEVGQEAARFKYNKHGIDIQLSNAKTAMERVGKLLLENIISS